MCDDIYCQYSRKTKEEARAFHHGQLLVYKDIIKQLELAGIKATSIDGCGVENVLARLNWEILGTAEAYISYGGDIDELGELE